MRIFFLLLLISFCNNVKSHNFTHPSLVFSFLWFVFFFSNNQHSAVGPHVSRGNQNPSKIPVTFSPPPGMAVEPSVAASSEEDHGDGVGAVVERVGGG